MKKVMAVVFALVLTMGMGVTVMADSVTKTVNVKTDTTVSVSAATDKDGAAVETSIEDMLSNEVFMSSVVKQATNVATNNGTNMDLLAVKDVSVPTGTTFPVTITFNVSGVKSGETIYVLHYSAVNNVWDSPRTVTAGDGTVTATFNDLSPVAFLRPAAAPFTPPVQEIHPPEYYEQLKAMYGANTQEPAAATATVSPKTAEDGGIAGFAAAAVLCAAVTVFAGKKKNA